MNSGPLPLASITDTSASFFHNIVHLEEYVLCNIKSAVMAVPWTALIIPGLFLFHLLKTPKTKDETHIIKPSAEANVDASLRKSPSKNTEYKSDITTVPITKSADEATISPGVSGSDDAPSNDDLPSPDNDKHVGVAAANVRDRPSHTSPVEVVQSQPGPAEGVHSLPKSTDRQVVEPVAQPIESTAPRCFILDSAGDRPLFQTAVTGFSDLLSELKVQLVSVSQDPAQAQQRMSTGGGAQTPVIVPCLAVSRVASCIESVMNKLDIPASHARLLVVFHPRAAHDQRVPSSRGQLGSQMRPDIGHMVDIVFDRANGQLYKSQDNRDSAAEMAKHIREAKQ